MWLNLFMDDYHLNNITKVGEKNHFAFNHIGKLVILQKMDIYFM